MGNAISNTVKKVKKAVYEWIFDPDYDPSLEDICPDLGRIQNITHDLYNKINRNFVDNFDALESELSKHFYDKLFHGIGNINDSDALRNFSNKFTQFINCSEYFYLTKVGDINRDFLMDNILSRYSEKIPKHKDLFATTYRTVGRAEWDSDCLFPYMHVSEEKWKHQAVVDHGEKIANDIKKNINNMKGEYPKAFNSDKDQSVKDMIELCWPSDNNIDIDKTKKFSKYYCYGYIYDLMIDLIDILDLYYEYLIRALSNSDLAYDTFYQDRWEEHRQNNMYKTWPRHGRLSKNLKEAWLLGILFKYRLDNRFETMKENMISKKKRLIEIFKRLRAISYKLEHIDCQILGSVPENAIIQNNDTLKFKLLRNGNDLDTDGEEVIIRLGNFGFTDWMSLGRKIIEKLPSDITIRTILPTSNQNQDNDEIDINSQINADIFQGLGGTGNSRQYNGKVYILFESDFKFKIMQSRLFHLLLNSDTEKESIHNDPLSHDYVGSLDINVPGDNNQVSRTLPAPGPHYIVIGPFESALTDRVTTTSKNNFLNNHLENYISTSFKDLGYQVLSNDRFKNRPQ